MTKQSEYGIGVDIGGSHITSAAINLETGEIFPESLFRMRVNSQGKAEHILLVWTECIQASMNTVGKENVKGLGVAMPGPFDYENGISLINDENQKKYISLYQLNLREHLAQRLNIQPGQLFFKNDAACFLLGEVFNGAAKGTHNSIGITLGTGLGSAIMINDDSKDAELWCSPFRNGVAEDYISTRWFLKRYYDLSGRNVADVKELSSLIQIDKTAKLVFDEFGSALGEFLKPLVLKYNPEVIVIGGNIANAWPLFIDPATKEIESVSKDIKIQKAILGEEAALIGAASLLA
ncbi:ROK family protein [Solitalea koreensis]|uniref:Glucokinase n=1 Tax=Solitalea koreensis TaxID=543615 RepID=A0A521E7H5_9SPHI|nr:ROK family protein [Solitalea koreensis]SMO79886.1 glucokinase [Solitalea koreensis]